jgi:hypothetical protein
MLAAADGALVVALVAVVVVELAAAVDDVELPILVAMVSLTSTRYASAQTNKNVGQAT